jgi:hypothetical protein
MGPNPTHMVLPILIGIVLLGAAWPYARVSSLPHAYEVTIGRPRWPAAAPTKP